MYSILSLKYIIMILPIWYHHINHTQWLTVRSPDLSFRKTTWVYIFLNITLWPGKWSRHTNDLTWMYMWYKYENPICISDGSDQHCFTMNNPVTLKIRSISPLRRHVKEHMWNAIPKIFIWYEYESYICSFVIQPTLLHNKVHPVHVTYYSFLWNMSEFSN